jgi:hypothetical protein
MADLLRRLRQRVVGGEAELAHGVGEPAQQRDRGVAPAIERSGALFDGELGEQAGASAQDDAGKRALQHREHQAKLLLSFRPGEAERLVDPMCDLDRLCAREDERSFRDGDHHGEAGRIEHEQRTRGARLLRVGAEPEVDAARAEQDAGACEAPLEERPPFHAVIMSRRVHRAASCSPFAKLR